MNVPDFLLILGNETSTISLEGDLEIGWGTVFFGGVMCSACFFAGVVSEPKIRLRIAIVV
jgi:hypothetical protein